MKKLAGILILISALFSIQTKATNYYFSSTDGDDSRTSAQAQNSSTPWRSIDKLNSIFSSLQPGDVVFFKRGNVFYGGISIKKSGRSGSPIIFDAYGSGEKPIITGFTDVTSWSNIGSNLWMSSNSVSSLATLNIVAVRGAFVPIGKWPTNGYNSLTQSGVGTSITDASLTSNWNGGTVVIRKNHWIIDKSTITSQSGTTINFSNPASYKASSGWGWFIQNSQSACDVQNEWWYDASTKKIGIYSSATPSGVQAASVDNLVDISSRSFINFNNIVFQGSNSAAVSISSGNNIAFEGCDFLFQGMDGFTVQSSAHHITLNNCTANYTNNDFVFGGGSENWTFTNNIITNTAQVPGMGNSAEGNYIALHNIGANSLIQYNVIKKTGYCGIDFRGSGISVLNNVVDTFCNVKDDGAGIYTFTGARTTTYAMRTVDHNIVLNGGGASAGTNTNNSDGYGIYMDDNSSEVTITNNTVANCGGAGLFLNADHNLVVQNNTIYNCVTTGSYGQLLHIYAGSVTTGVVKNITLTGNKIISKTSSQLVAYLKFTGVDMSQLGTWDNNYYCRPSNENGSTFQVLASSTQTTNLAGWQSSSSKDMSSQKSPKTISDVKDLRFEYNANSFNKIVNLGATYMDVTGKNYNGSITLAPYSSAVLIYVSGTAASQSPVANAGPDQNFSLPTSNATLTGSGSEPDGTITEYQWTKVAGPSQYTIASPGSAKTDLSNLAQGVYQFELQVTDNSGATAKDTISVTVNAGSNQPPVADAGKNQTILLPADSTTLNGSSSSDKDGTISTYKWSEISGPSQYSIASLALAKTGLTNLEQGVYQFELQVTDNSGATAKDTISVTVNAASDQPPVADAGKNQTISLPVDSATLSGNGSSDKDGTITTYIWSEISGPSSAGIETPNLIFTNVTALIKGTYTFELKVTDNQDAVGKDTVTIIVNEKATGNISNQPPVADAGKDQTIALPADSAILSGSGSSDKDGSITTYKWSEISGPSSAGIETSNLVSTNVATLVKGTYTFELKVTDNQGAVGKDTVSLIVNEKSTGNISNQAPVADAGEDQTILLPVDSATLSGSGSSDKDGGITTYKWSEISGPSSVGIKTSNLVSTNVETLVKGTYKFELKVSDNHGSIGRDTVTIIVNEKSTTSGPNQPPVADAGKNQTISLPLDSATLSGSGSSDKDGGITTYKWSEISGPSSAGIKTSNLASTNVETLVKGTYKFELKVTDNRGAIGKDTVTIIVNEKSTSNSSNQPPVADAGKNQTISLPLDSATLSGSGSSDKDGGITTYKWSEISGPSSAGIETPNLISTNVTTLVKGSYKFELKVTDNQGAIGGDTITITVNSEIISSFNQRPIANAGLDINMTLPTNSFAITGKGSDADGSVSSFKWDKISGPYCIIQNPNEAKTVINNLTEGIYVFELEVTDNQNAIGRDTLRITVNTASDPASSSNADSEINSFTIYPNPVTTDNLNVEVNSSNTGKMSVQIVSAAGVLVNSFIFDKDQENKKVNLPSRELTAGVYFVRIQIGNWTDTKKIVKL